MKHDHAPFTPPNCNRPNPAARQAYAASPSADQRQIEDRVRRFLPLVHNAAWHIYGTGRDGMEVEDLVQVGLIALTDCARRHEGHVEERGEDGFAAYAKMRVRGAMFDCLRKSAAASRGAMKRMAARERERAGFLSLHGREPSLAELAELLGIDQASLLGIEAENIQLGSIDLLYDETSTAFADDELDPFQALAEQQDSAALTACIAQLPERLQTVLQLYFVEELNLTEIAEVLEVSVPRVHQLKASALLKLREVLT